MKTRRGFISNSSSTSFIATSSQIDDLEYKTTSQVAFDILTFLLEGYLEEYEGQTEVPVTERLLRLQAGLVWCRNSETYDGVIRIPFTINYDTWLHKKNGEIRVLTSNNHHWEDALDITYPRNVENSPDTHESLDDIHDRWQEELAAEIGIPWRNFWDDDYIAALPPDNFLDMGKLITPRNWRFHQEERTDN